ncbi:MAG: aminotransferase class V-fold PLP-dependent enzyme [Myxococcales bacterium]|nr:MAG: aminotransferase class V-fold PLP-dependent enzyme [Myxococcales bacterium]
MVAVGAHPAGATRARSLSRFPGPERRRLHYGPPVTVPVFALGDRSLFPDLQAKAYLAHAAVAPVSSLVKEAVNRLLGGYAAQGNGAFFEWMDQRERLREKLGRLIGARAEDIALGSGTSRGLTDVALSMPWRSGDKIVLFDREFPANVCPWQRAAELFGLRLAFVDMSRAITDTGTILEQVEVELRGGARLVAVSAVQFQTGLFMPLEELGKLCQRYGAELCVDAIQACGVLPLSVERMGIDYLVTGGHKWLLGPEGVGFVYARAERARALLPRTSGWLSHEDGTSFLFAGKGQLRYDRPVKSSIQMLESGSCSAMGFAALEAAIEPLLALTPAAIFQHVGGYLDGLESGLVARGFRSLRAAKEAARSAILTVDPPAGVGATELVSELRSRGVYASMPDGLLRLAPHFSNAASEIETVLGAVDESLQVVHRG